MEIITIKPGGANCYILKYDENWILIDVGTNFKKLVKLINNYGLNYNNLKLVIITHCHPDHVGALNQFKAESNCKVLIHEKEKDTLEKGYSAPEGGTIILSKAIEFIANNLLKGISTFKPVKPDIVIEDTYDLKDYGINARIQCTPGHTEGSISVIVDNKVAIVGDVLFNIMPNTIISLYSNDKSKLLQSCEGLLKSKYSIYYLGHGEPLTYEDYKKKFQNMKKKLM